MSTSPESKQAALDARIRIVNYLLGTVKRPLARFEEDEIEHIITNAIDAATAKYELELQRANAKCAEQAAATAKLREELVVAKKQQAVLERMLSDKVDEQASLPELAHQQPSARTSEDVSLLLSELHTVATALPSDQWLESKEIIRRARAWIKERSAPTPNVEKIALETAQSIARSRGEDEPHELDQAFIQQAIDAATTKLREELASETERRVLYEAYIRDAAVAIFGCRYGSTGDEAARSPQGAKEFLAELQLHCTAPAQSKPAPRDEK